jgi:peptidoglycan/LPS O-acetylase OafA/YrhL
MVDHHRNIPALDGVRGLAVVLVILSHGNILANGFGVDMFFVLSGFLISSILMNEANAFGTINLKNFYARRLLRLYPALVILVVSVLLIIYFGADDSAFTMALADGKAVLLYYFNYRVSGIPIAELTWWRGFFIHCWSLSVEEQFYLVWPLILMLAARVRLAPVYILLIIVAGIVYPVIARPIFWDGQPWTSIYFRTDTRMDSLMWGALIAWITVHGRVSKKRFAPIVGIAGALGLAIIFLLSVRGLIDQRFHYMFGFALIAASSAALIAALVWYPPPVLLWLFEMSWLRWIGKISYGVYLAHVPAMKLHQPWMNKWTFTLTLAVVSISAAAATFYLVERRFLRLKARFPSGPRRVPDYPAAAPQPRTSSSKKKIPAARDPTNRFGRDSRRLAGSPHLKRRRPAADADFHNKMVSFRGLRERTLERL